MNTRFHLVRHDGHRQTHTVTQAEGGEQGDPLMAALFSLGQHAALTAVQRQLQPGEALYAYITKASREARLEFLG